MGFFDWLGRGTKKGKKRAARSDRKFLPASGHRLFLEPLEHRRVLSVTVSPITGPDANSAFDVPSGKDLYVPLNGTDAGQTISYSVTSSNPDVTATILSGNPTLELNVSGTTAGGNAFSGAITFQLFKNIAPQTVQGIIDQVNAGLYNGASFYRMETASTFQLIQGGIEKTTGKSDTTVLPDEFNVAAGFNSSGLLAMANGGPGTATSEFFVTAPNRPLADDPQTLNYGYTIFGQILTGLDIYNDILNVPTTLSSGLDLANTPVTITSASIITDTQNGVVQISEPNSFTGKATITVTGQGSTDGSSAQQSFSVVAASPTSTSATGPPLFLSPVANQTTTTNTLITFQLNATDPSGTTPAFTVTGASSFTGAPADVQVTVTPGTGSTATVTLTPVSGFSGTIDLVAHADDSANALHDAQAFTLTVSLKGPPTVTPTTTNENQQTTTGLVISPAAVDGTAVTNYLITGITDGTLFQNDGVTPITNGSMITAAQGTAGLKFTPANNFVGQGSFTVQESPDANAADAKGTTAVAAITVNPAVMAGPPTVTATSVTENHQTTTGLVISPAAADGTLVTDYRITGITNGTLFQNDGVTAITNGSMITAAQGTAGLKFTPTNNFVGQGNFTVQESPDVNAADASGTTAVATITVNQGALAGPPTVTATTTTANHQTTAGPVISPAAADAASVTNYLITNITNGTLFQSDGVTAIANGSMITAAQGTAGLKFTPTANFVGQGSFSVQESTDANAADASGANVAAAVTVNPVNHAPQGTSKTVTITQDTVRTFSVADFGFSDPNDSPANSLKAVEITTLPTAGNLDDNGFAVTAGQFIAVVDINGGLLKYTPATGAFGTPFATFTFQVQDNGGTANGGVDVDPSPRTITINVTPNPSTISGEVFADVAGVAAKNGGQFSGQHALDGTLVTLQGFDANFQPIGSLQQFTIGTPGVTDGTYSFTITASGTYFVTFTPPAGFLPGTVVPHNASDTVEPVQNGTYGFSTQINGGGVNDIKNNFYVPGLEPSHVSLRFLLGSSLAAGAKAVAVTPSLAGPPTVTSTSVTANHQTTTGLVISPAAADGTLVTNYLITGITNGTLFQNDGITAKSPMVR